MHPIYDVLSDNNICEIELLRHIETLPHNCLIKIIEKKNFWYPLTSSNHWLYSFPNDQIVNLICNSSMKTFKLSNSSTIKVPSTCHIKSKGSSLQSQNVQTISINNNFIPSLNLTLSLNSKSSSVKFNNQTFNHIILTNELEDIKARLEEHKKQEFEFEKHKNNNLIHNIHHYSSTYIIAILLIILAVYLIMKIKSSRLLPETRKETTIPITELIGMNLKNTQTQSPSTNPP